VSHVEVTEETIAVILQAVAQLPYPLGRTGLTRVLAGSAAAAFQADRFPLFGALAGQTQKSIRNAILQLVDRDLLASFEKGGYRLLRLTGEGHAWLKKTPIRQTPISPSDEVKGAAPQAIETASSTSQQDSGEYDEGLFERLRAWRLEVSREIDKPAFVVFHDTVLKRIAARRPETLDELLAIKGIGPSKLEKYGRSVLDIITGKSAMSHDQR
jgi:superfamily II DNA helicase RecQ